MRVKIERRKDIKWEIGGSERTREKFEIVFIKNKIHESQKKTQSQLICSLRDENFRIIYRAFLILTGILLSGYLCKHQAKSFAERFKEEKDVWWNTQKSLLDHFLYVLKGRFKMKWSKSFASSETWFLILYFSFT